MSTQQTVAYLVEQPGTDGTLFALDLRHYNWTAVGFSAVARRDVLFREPAVPPKVAAFLRSAIGVTADPKTLHVEAMVSGPFLFRDTIETDRSPSYYDLLYGNQRFPAGKQMKKVEKVVEVEETYTDREWVQTGPYQGQGYWRNVERTRKIKQTKLVDVDAGLKFIDFPRDKKDWDEFYGIASVKDFLRQQRFKTEFGAVVSGMTEVAKGGSFVARNNRLVTFLPIPTGLNLETFDVAKATGRKDYLEQSPKLAEGLIEFDAQELLAPLPNGGQAALLTDGKGRRLELAAGQVAIGPGKNFPQIRNPGDCVTCHAPAHGLIPPRNLVKDLLDQGIDVEFRDKQKLKDFVGFYLEWEERLSGSTVSYQLLLKKTTRADHADPRSKSWTGAELAKEFARWRDWYDDPVTPEQAACELGVPLEVLKGLSAQTLTGRPKLLVRGLSIPRPGFDEDTLPLLAAILVSK